VNLKRVTVDFSSGLCCDQDTCKIRPSSDQCRPAKDQHCDFADFCSGESEWCPDLYKRDGTPCVRGNSTWCYQGQCRTHESQCQYVWGANTPQGKMALPGCYEKNLEGKMIVLYRTLDDRTVSFKNKFLKAISRCLLCSQCSSKNFQLVMQQFLSQQEKPLVVYLFVLSVNQCDTSH